MVLFTKNLFTVTKLYVADVINYENLGNNNINKFMLLLPIFIYLFSMIHSL